MSTNERISVQLNQEEWHNQCWHLVEGFLDRSVGPGLLILGHNTLGDFEYFCSYLEGKNIPMERLDFEHSDYEGRCCAISELKRRGAKSIIGLYKMLPIQHLEQCASAVKESFFVVRAEETCPDEDGKKTTTMDFLNRVLRNIAGCRKNAEKIIAKPPTVEEGFSIIVVEEVNY